MAYRGLVVVVVVVVVEKGDEHIITAAQGENRARAPRGCGGRGGHGGTAESIPGMVGGRAKALGRREDRPALSDFGEREG